jgi:uncharacterized protein (TIGR02391 family)
MPPRAFTLSGEEVLALPVDELALEILRDIAADEDQWNSANWVLSARGQYKTPAIDALIEAWAWLYANGLVAANLESNNTLYAFVITRLGRQVVDEGIEPVRAMQRLAMDLHSLLEPKIRRLYLMGDYELAAFAAMKAVEVRVRSISKSSGSLLGVKLMRTAFGEGGMLREESLDGGEQTARMELFSGAIGLFKNPTSHRDVEYDDPAVAAEVILLADLLMRILDGIEREYEARQRAEAAAQRAEAFARLIRSAGRPDSSED